MKSRWSINRVGRVSPLLIVLVGLLVVFPGQVLAGGGHNKHNHGHGNGHGHYYRAHPSHRYVVVPRRIYVEDRSYFHPYYAGRAYYAPHHHYHAAYRFPVYVNGAVVVRPYSYCGDEVFVAAPVAAPLPRLAFSVTFGTPVAYYPAPVPYYPPGFSGSFVYVHHGD